MLDFAPTYKNRDFYVPAYEIKINRKELSSDVACDVMEVRYTDDVEKIDTFDITANNWDAEKLDFKYTGSKKGLDAGTDAARSTLFDPGQEIEIWMGYFKPTPDNPTPIRMMLVGIITSLTPNFPASGSPTLKVSGQNILRDFIAAASGFRNVARHLVSGSRLLLNCACDGVRDIINFINDFLY